MVAIPGIAQLRPEQVDVITPQVQLSQSRANMMRARSLQEQVRMAGEDRQRGIDDSVVQMIQRAVPELKTEREYFQMKDLAKRSGASPKIMDHFADDFSDYKEGGFKQWQDEFMHYAKFGEEKPKPKLKTDRLPIWNEETGKKSFMNVPADTIMAGTEPPKGYTFTDPAEKKKGEGKPTEFEKIYQDEVAIAKSENRKPPSRMEVKKELKKTEAGEIKMKLTVSDMKTAMLGGKKDEYDSNSYDFNTTNKRDEVAYWDTKFLNETKVIKIPKELQEGGWTPAKIQEKSDATGMPIEDILKEIGVI